MALIFPNESSHSNEKFKNLYDERNDIHRILLLESVIYEEEFYILDFILFLVKFSLNFYVINGSSSSDKNCIENLIKTCGEKLLDNFLIKEQIFSECMAGIGGKIKEKAKRFAEYLKHPLNPMPESKVVLNDILKKPLEQPEIKGFIDDFFKNCLFDDNDNKGLLPRIQTLLEKTMASDKADKLKKMAKAGSFVPLGVPGVWPNDVGVFTDHLYQVLEQDRRV